MNGNSPSQNRRLIFIIMSLADTLLGGLVLLLYFGYLPFDISNLGIPDWLVGAFGALWFFSGLGVLAYQMTKTVDSE